MKDVVVSRNSCALPNLSANALLKFYFFKFAHALLSRFSGRHVALKMGNSQDEIVSTQSDSRSGMYSFVCGRE